MSEDKILLPHHEQQSLCTTRLPYRQGRKLTAVKVYTVTTESNHLLVFGVPSLNLRQEAKALFMKFGTLLQFTLSPDHAAEVFTETYHAQYERIHSARVAKKMLDTNNFYGGSLHVCYAPEFETIEETKQKLFQRQRDVLNRLRNLEKGKTSDQQSAIEQTQISIVDSVTQNATTSNRLNMGEVNTFNISNEIIVTKKKKRKGNVTSNTNKHEVQNYSAVSSIDSSVKKRLETFEQNATVLEIIDATSPEKEVVTNINESLNYNKFGNEVIRKVPEKPLNKIIFNLNKES